MSRPFWETKTLTEMTRREWESLCDGCGTCCLVKLEDVDSGDIFFTNVACRLLDEGTCRCGDYPNRFDTVPDCIQLTPHNVAETDWLPKTCAYRLVHEGRKLPEWHPLISGDPRSVHRAGISVRGMTVSEDKVHDDEMEEHIIRWVDF